MRTRLSAEAAIEAATEILVAFLQNSSVTPAELPGLVRKVRAAVETDLVIGEATSSASEDILVEATAPAPSPPANAPPPHETRPPAVPVEESVHRDYIVSLEDGAHYRSLRRHLMSKYGMTPDDYRAKWNLPDDYPMVAPSYAEARSEVAKRTGLGRAPTEKRRTRR